MSLVVKANLKAAAVYEGRQFNVSSDLADKLSEKVDAIVKEACKRAHENGRTTVMPKDL